MITDLFMINEKNDLIHGAESRLNGLAGKKSAAFKPQQIAVFDNSQSTRSNSSLLKADHTEIPQELMKEKVPQDFFPIIIPLHTHSFLYPVTVEL